MRSWFQILTTILPRVWHISHSNTYEIIDRDPTPTLAAEGIMFANEALRVGLIDEVEAKFIKPPARCRTPVFYHLWKTHKTPLSVRPIVSGCSGPTANLASFLDYHLKRKLREIPAHLFDTDGFIKTLVELPPLPLDVILVTADVKNLYTTIPQEERITALLQSCSNLSPFPPQVTKRALDLVFKRNCFVFCNNIYHQKTGVAMGSPLTPTLAIIFMDVVECNYIQSQHLVPILYRRYIDDIFLIWTHGEASLSVFMNGLNEAHPSIKFTWDISKTSVNFLDLTIFKSRNSPHPFL